MTAFLAILSTLAITILGFITFVNNPKLRSNRYFVGFCGGLGLWVISNYLADADPDRSLFWTRMAFTSVVIATLFFRLFVGIFPKKVLKLSVRVSLLAVASVVMTGIIWTEYFIPTVEFANGTSNVVPGPIYPAFIVYFLSLAGISIYTLVYQFMHLTGLDRDRLRLILYGLMFVVLIGSLFNLFLPLVMGSNQFAEIGTYSTVIFVSFIFLAIVRHRLFDIRVIVARSVAYILLVGSLGAIFAATLLALSTLFVKDEQISTSVKVTYVGLALLLAFLFQPLKRIFDKISNSIFYRDAYDAQDTIDSLNSALVTTIDLEELLSRSSRVIKGKLKLEFCYFAVHGAGNEISLLTGYGSRHLTEEKVDELKNAAHTLSKRVIVADELESGGSKLKDLLQQSGIAVVVKLEGNIASSAKHPGYIILGQKSSGSIYSSQDIKILEIMADELVIAIQNSLRFEEIKRFNVTLQKKIEEATQELRRANTKLRELDKTKDEFISMASHQLRTPLTTVKGYLSMVLEGDEGKVKASQKDLLQRAFDGADRMVYLIADLLNVSRLQSGKFVIENKPTDLVKLVSAQVDQLQESAANHRLKLTFHKPDNFPQLMLDETKIQQVVMNFLDNAIYYTPAGGSVTAALSATDKEITYTVTDTGLGVPKAEQHHLFAKFYRAGNARKMRPDGTGLGLFMAKKVIIAQGGAIIFKSTEGKGSVFGFSFPRHAVEAKK